MRGGQSGSSGNIPLPPCRPARREVRRARRPGAHPRRLGGQARRQGSLPSRRTAPAARRAVCLWRRARPLRSSSQPRPPPAGGARDGRCRGRRRTACRSLYFPPVCYYTMGAEKLIKTQPETGDPRAGVRLWTACRRHAARQPRSTASGQIRIGVQSLTADAARGRRRQPRGRQCTPHESCRQTRSLG